MSEVKKPFKISDLSAIELSDLDSRDLLLISDFDASDGKSSKSLSLSVLSAYMKDVVVTESTICAITPTVTEQVTKSVSADMDEKVEEKINTKVQIKDWYDDSSESRGVKVVEYKEGETVCQDWIIDGGDSTSGEDTSK